MSTNTKLINRNFLIVIIGQMISLFGNAILRFALPLYLLDQTGSSAIFGSTLAISTIPTILFSPFGGILADRVNRRNLMVCLDFITAIVISICGILLSIGQVVIIVTMMMMIFSIIQSFYQPTVQASIPMIVPKKDLEKANSFVSLVNAFSNIAGPLLGGVIYGIYGIWPIIIIGAICFLASSIMELFIQMKYTPTHKKEKIYKIIKNDLKESLEFLTKDKPVMLKAMGIVAGMNLFLTSMFIVGLPAMVKLKLGLSNELYGFAQAGMALGMIVGGITISIFDKAFQPDNSYKLLGYAVLFMIPIGVVFSLNLPPMIIYYTIVICSLLIMAVITMFSITMITFVQRETPEWLVGKVLAYVLVLCQCSLPIGQSIYGFLFEYFIEAIDLIVLATVMCNGIIVILSKIVFDKFKDLDNS